jgi:MFS family permease
MSHSTSAPSSETSAAGLGVRLDRLRWTPAHLGILVALGAGWLFDSLEVNLVGSFVGPMQDHFHATNTQVSLVFWAWLIGIMVGALAGGRLADRFGRRRLFVLTLLWYAAFTTLTGLAPSLGILIGLRFLTALGVGAEYAVVNSAIAELMPARHRGKASAVVMSFWPVGAIGSGLIALVLLDLLSLPTTVSWRYGFAVGGVVALLVLILRRRVPESPRWLASQGRYADAEAVVARLEAAAGITDGLGAEAAVTPARRRGSLRELIRDHPGRLALGCALDLSEAFGYYGIFALVAIVGFRSVGISEANVPYFFILGNVGGLAGGLTMAALFDRVGRRRVVTCFYLLAAAAAVLLGLALEQHSAALVLAAFMISNAAATGAWTSAYPTFTELFPTHLRGAGVGASVAVGRLGAAYGVTLVTAVGTSGSVLGACMIVAAFWIAGAAAMVVWARTGGVEGAGRSLEDLARTVPAAATEMIGMAGAPLAELPGD